MFVQGARDLQPADKCECSDVLTAVGDFVQLVLEGADVRFKVVDLTHLDSEKVVIVAFSFPMRCVLGEERFGHLKVAKGMWRQRVEPI